METKNYRQLANRLRKHVLDMIHKVRTSHIGSCYSIIDILTVLYFEILKVDSKNPSMPERDRFILSKGHAGAAVYAVLAEKGFFEVEELESYVQNGSKLLGHISHDVPGVEASTGALGHGLGIGCGIAFVGKKECSGHRVFVLISDGECDEGSTWEAALFAQHHELDNLIVIIDYNKFQSLGKTNEVINLEPLASKWHSFGWSVQEIDGHNFEQIEKAFKDIPYETEKPSCIIAHTTKGKGVSFMENKLIWHYYSPDADEYKMAAKELGNNS